MHFSQSNVESECNLPATEEVKRCSGMNRRVLLLVMRFPFVKIVVVLVCHFCAHPAAVAAQAAPQSSSGWLALGIGGGAFADSDAAYSAVVELAYQRGPHLLALRASGVGEIDGSDVVDLGLLYGRATTGRGIGHASIAIGLAYVGADGFGVPLAADASIRTSVIGVGLKAFANLNNQRSFIGLALVVQLGSLR